MCETIAKIFGNIWGTIIMSVVPLIELKGGIVFARGVEMSFLQALCLSYVGSVLIFVPVFFLLRPILTLLKKVKFVKRFTEKIENYFQNRARKTIDGRGELQQYDDVKRGNGLSECSKKMLGVFVFVAIPLPMTGVWTGTAVAVFLDLKFKNVILPIMLGNFVAGMLISLLVELCLYISGDIMVLDYILWILFGLAFIFLVFGIIKIIKSDNKNAGEK